MKDAELQERGEMKLLLVDDTLHVSDTSQLNCRLSTYEIRDKLREKLKARAAVIGIEYDYRLRWWLDCEVKDDGVYHEGERIADEVPFYTFCGIR